MKILLTASLVLLIVCNVHAQNVGIGTITPGDKLEVNGNIRLSGAPADSVYAAPSTTGGGKSIYIKAGDAYVPVGGGGGSVYILATNNMPAGGSGYTNLGPSGTINMVAGSGYNSAGGNISITAGATSCWAIPAGSHADVLISGGQNLNTTDASSIIFEGGYTIGTSCPPPGAAGGNLVLKPGIGSGTGNNGQVKLDGAIAYGVSMGLAGGASGSPVSLVNQKSYVGISPADNINNYYQLPAPSSYPGRMYIIRDNSPANNAILTTAAGSIFAGSSSTPVATYTLNFASAPKTVMAVSDGNNWTVMKQD